MKSVSVLVAVALLAVTAQGARAADKAAKRKIVPARLEPAPAPATGPEVPKAEKGDKVEVVMPRLEPVADPAPVAGTITPCQPKKAVPCAAAPCRTRHADGAHWDRIVDWLCYRPAKGPGLCGCWPKCYPECTPPLYQFFLDRCATGGCRGPAYTGCADGACHGKKGCR
jgi:hypothetical protein